VRGKPRAEVRGRGQPLAHRLVLRSCARLDQTLRTAENHGMAYFEAGPGPRLAPFVERVCFSSDGGDGPPPGVRVVPDGAADLLFSVARDGSCAAHLFGVKTRALWVETPDPRENVLLRLGPGAAARLFGVAASELTDREIPLDALVGARGAEWCERLAGARSAQARRARLEAVLGDWSARAAREPDRDDALLHTVVSRLRASRGTLRIAVLADSLGVGARRLERLFLARVGVTPKAFARIVRFFAAYRSLEAGRDPISAALEHGYFDQPHLNREFRRLAGAPPRRIFPSGDAGGPDSLRA
jgi:methylphosphotriester-DNA--protein-cysteine methyltransferase